MSLSGTGLFPDTRQLFSRDWSLDKKLNDQLNYLY
jgi:hypothetical protein